MDLTGLIADSRNSVNTETARKISRPRYDRMMASLGEYWFWKGSRRHNIRPLFENQTSALALAAAYLNSDVRLRAEGDVPEAALIKMPTGTGKSGVVAVLARCLPQIRKVLVLTPRAALAQQMRRDVAWRFWKRLGFEAGEKFIFSADADVAGARLAEAEVLQLLPSNVPDLLTQLGYESRTTVIGTFQALEQLRRAAAGLQLVQQRLEILVGHKVYLECPDLLGQYFGELIAAVIERLLIARDETHFRAWRQPNDEFPDQAIFVPMITLRGGRPLLQ